MKKVFQKSGAFTMVFLMLFSTMSFAVEKHFCGKVLVDQSVFSEAESCCMDTSEENLPDEDPCCNEENVSIEGQDELKTSFNQLDLQQQVFLASFGLTYINLFEYLPGQVIPFKDYSPPVLIRDILVLDQVFII